MTREELCIHACKYAIGELTRKGSSAFITSAHEGRQQITWVEVMEWLDREQCEDAISRQAYIERYRKWSYSEYGRRVDNDALAIRVAMSLPPVTPQSKIGYWISYWDEEARCHVYKCPKCGNKQPFDTKCCWECGNKLSEILTGSESENKDEN